MTNEFDRDMIAENVDTTTVSTDCVTGYTSNEKLRELIERWENNNTTPCQVCAQELREVIQDE